MEPFITLTGVAAPIDEANVDTNQLCPTRFNKVPRGPAHARILFHDRRFGPDGREKDFILNRPLYRNAQIIVADRNWGCGSSRESAVYALYEFGIRCVIAPSFADIHAANCCKNGLLPVVLPDTVVTDIRSRLHELPGAMLTVDLAGQTVTDSDGNVHSFHLHPVRRRCLLEGLDDLGRTERHGEEFAVFERDYRALHSWLYAACSQSDQVR